jgi:tRNA(adenine34) deaminase
MMRHALTLARQAFVLGEVPVGAVISINNQLVAAAHNEVEMRRDATAHAELLAIGRAMRMVGDKYLPDARLYVTLEPCPMCIAAIRHAKIKRLVFGAYDPKGGGVVHRSAPLHNLDIISGIEEQACGQLLKDFFKQRR